jgi:cell division protease FtsH
LSVIAHQPTDDLDRKIDANLDRVGKFLGFWFRIFKWALVVDVLAFVIFFSPWSETLAPIFLAVMQFIFQVFAVIFMALIQFVAIFWFLGRGRMYWMMPGETGVGFKDYRGNPEILDLANRIVTLLRGVKNFREMGGETHRGLLMVGPPGTGKSYLAMCIATEAGVPFAYASAPSFQNMFFGVGNLKVMMLYNKARKMARKYGACIVFIDEIDAIGMSRSAGGNAGGGLMGMMGMGGAGLLNELLLQMDPPRLDDGRWWARLLRMMGLRANPGDRPSVLTMAATNLPDVLDPALLRPGRFDWQITIDAPDYDGRKEVIEYYLDKVKHVSTLDMDRLAMDTIGYTPVAIKYIINEAAVVAHFDGRSSIDYPDLALAMEMFETGLRQPIKSMSWAERRRIAYHEAGHAIAQVKLMPRERIVQLTIIRHKGSLGYMMPKPIEDIYGFSTDELLSEIQVALAGKGAEQVYLQEEYTGATSDLRKATFIAGTIIGMYGMAGSLYAVGAFGEPPHPDPKQKRDIEKILEDQFKKVKALLAQYHGAADEIVDRLLDKGDLRGEEVIDIIAQFEERTFGRASAETIGDRTEEHRFPDHFVGQLQAARNPGPAAAPGAAPGTASEFTWIPRFDR